MKIFIILVYIWWSKTGNFVLTFILLFADYDSDDRYAVAHNVNDYEENDDDNDEPMTKDYNSRKQDRNFYR